MDPFGYYNEGIQQRLDDAFVEGESSSQQADQYSPSAEELPPSVLSPTSPILAPKEAQASSPRDAQQVSQPSSPNCFWPQSFLLGHREQICVPRPSCNGILDEMGRWRWGGGKGICGKGAR